MQRSENGIPVNLWWWKFFLCLFKKVSLNGELKTERWCLPGTFPRRSFRLQGKTLRIFWEDEKWKCSVISFSSLFLESKKVNVKHFTNKITKVPLREFVGPFQKRQFWIRWGFREKRRVRRSLQEGPQQIRLFESTRMKKPFSNSRASVEKKRKWGERNFQQGTLLKSLVKSKRLLV